MAQRTDPVVMRRAASADGPVSRGDGGHDAGGMAPRSDDAVGPAAARRELRDGRAAMHHGNLAGAVECFDHARAPVVAEDATSWVAVVVERAGDRGGAAQRSGPMPTRGGWARRG